MGGEGKGGGAEIKAREHRLRLQSLGPGDNIAAGNGSKLCTKVLRGQDHFEHDCFATQLVLNFPSDIAILQAVDKINVFSQGSFRKFCFSLFDSDVV